MTYGRRAMKRKTLGMATAIGMCALVVAQPVPAALLQIDFTGSISDLTTFGSPGAPALETVFSVGDAVSGTAIYDTTATQTSSTPTRAVYAGALQSIMATIAGSEFTATGGSTTVDDDNGLFLDGLSLNGVVGVSGPSIGGVSAERVKLHLQTSVLTTLTGVGLPDLVDLATLFSNNEAGGNINFVAFDNGETARFDLTSLTASNVTVPAPGTLVLVLGGAALARWRRSDRRSSSGRRSRWASGSRR